MAADDVAALADRITAAQKPLGTLRHLIGIHGPDRASHLSQALNEVEQALAGHAPAPATDWVIDIRATSEPAGRAVAAGLVQEGCAWARFADPEPGPSYDRMVWEGTLRIRGVDQPVRVIAVIEHPERGED